MKRFIAVLIILTMVIGGAVMVFADNEEVVVHELSGDVLERVNEIKKEFLDEKVSEGLITQLEADEMYGLLVTQTGHDTLRELGFGIWLRDSDYFDEIFDLLPHKNMSDNGFFGGGMRRGQMMRNRTENETCPLGYDVENRPAFEDRPHQGQGRRFQNAE